MTKWIIIAAIVALVAHLVVQLSDRKSVSVLSAPTDSRQLEPADQEKMDLWTIVYFLALGARAAAVVAVVGLLLWRLIGH